MRAGRFEAEASLTMTPAGLLAIGGLVASILLSVPPIVRAASKWKAPALPGGGQPPLLTGAQRDSLDALIEGDVPRIADQAAPMIPGSQ